MADALVVDSMPQSGRWKRKRSNRANAGKAREAAFSKRQSINGARDAAASAAADQVALHENLALAQPEVYAMGLPGMARPMVVVTCKCVGCTDGQASAGRRAITKADFGTDGGLKNKAELAQELGAHGLTTFGKKGELQDRLRDHAIQGAYYLTALAPASAPGAPALPRGPAESSLSASEDPRIYTRGFLGNARTLSDAPPSPDRAPMETRQARGLRMAEEVEVAMPRPYIRDGVADDPELAAAYGLGFSAIIAGCLRYSDFKRFMFAREGVRKLSFREWGEVTALSLYLSQRLLNEYIKAGIDVSREVNEELRTRRLEGWRHYWPLGQHADRVRALIVDTCWPVPGYTSPHGMTHLQDATTQLVLAVCHLTKHKDDAGVISPPPSPPSPSLIHSRGPCRSSTSKAGSCIPSPKPRGTWTLQVRPSASTGSRRTRRVISSTWC